ANSLAAHRSIQRRLERLLPLEAPALEIARDSIQRDGVYRNVHSTLALSCHQAHRVLETLVVEATGPLPCEVTAPGKADLGNPRSGARPSHVEEANIAGRYAALRDGYPRSIY